MNTHTLIFLFNHAPTQRQLDDARRSLGTTRFIEPPEKIHACWQQVPPDPEAIAPYLAPVRRWLMESGTPGDFVLIQGDFGATYLMVRYALEMGLVPVYSTTERQAVEEKRQDGSVKLTHTFKHRRFRRYGA